MSYKQGIATAIGELKERGGSSMQAIKKHMQSQLPSDKKWRNTFFLSSLKSMVTDGDLIQTKGHYKISPDFKKKLTDASKPKKVGAPKKAAPKKKTTTTKKKTGVAPKKKAAPKKKVTVKKKTTIKKKSAPKKKATPSKKVVKKAASPKKSAKKTAPKKKAPAKK